MINSQIHLTATFPASAKTVFAAWLDSKQHGDMVEGVAKIDPSPGGDFSIWGGGAIGETVSIDEDNLTIVQSWRYNYEDWPENEPSTISLKFTDKDGGCQLDFEQTGAPEKYLDDIKKGWQEYYWKPMKRYFSKQTR